MSYEFNGLVDSVLPNIYINKITLEHLHSQPLSSNKYDITPHINQSVLSEGESSLTPTHNTTDLLQVVFDMFLEIPNIDGSDFWSVLLDDDILKYLSTNIILFSGKEGKKYYMHTIGQPQAGLPSEFTSVPIQDVLAHPDWHLLFHLDSKDYTIIKETSMFNQLAEPGLFLGESTEQSDSQKLDYIKQKYTETLPDGTIVYKIPIRVAIKSNDWKGAFPTDLAAIAYCALDLGAIAEDTTGASIPADELGASDYTFSRLAAEVIIKDGKTQDKGMLFYVSNDQRDGDEVMSDKREAAFDDMKGELWLGAVHPVSVAPGTLRYMAGLEHVQNLVHPYLDYAIVPNTRIQDYRQLSAMKKQVLNFNSIGGLVFGGDYVDLRSNTTAAHDNSAIFSNLISSVNKSNHVKLFFTIDFGKLVKKHCAVPALIDKLAVGGPIAGPTALEELIGKSSRLLSFRVFREHLSVSNDISNKNNKELLIAHGGSRNIAQQNERKLVYDHYPKLHYFNNEKYPRHVSSLAPVKLTLGSEAGSAPFLKSFSLTDRSLERSSGAFKYSIEIVTFDPTLDLFVQLYTKVQSATKTLKKYMNLANGPGLELGAPPTTHYWNSYLGKFEQSFIDLVTTGTADTPGLGFNTTADNALPDNIISAISIFQFVTQIVRGNYTPAVTETNVEDHPGPTGADWLTPIQNMLNPQTASPSSITAVCEIFDTFASQMKRFIESFSTAKIPKTASAQHENADGSKSPILQQFTKVPVGAEIPSRKMTIRHAFEDPSELVDTRQWDAGYDIFGAQENKSPYDIGLKTIHWSQYLVRSSMEHAACFVGDSFSKPLVVPIDETLSQEVQINTAPTKGRFFTALENSYNPNDPGGQRFYTSLPETIKSPDEENEYWKLINNIIRYNFGILGNPGEKSYLGYGEEYENLLKNPDSSFINDAMERIIKEYQSLVYKGATFSPEYATKSDPMAQPPLGTGTEQETPPNPSMLPPAGNIGQERFLLALIMQDYLNLRFHDLSLATFDPTVISTSDKSNIMTNHLKKVFWPAASGPGFFDSNSGLAAMQNLIDILPNQIKALMLNYAFPSTLNPNIRYSEGTPNKIYAGNANTKMKTMHASKFGEFWFRHQNLVEVEYLAGYESAVSVPPPIPASQINEFLASGTTYSPPELAPTFSPSRYEDIYGGSIKKPIWKPVTESDITAFAQDDDLLLLCRLKKYRHPIFNQKAYSILDLPLYDEYFFVYESSTDNPWESASGWLLWPAAPEPQLHSQWTTFQMGAEKIKKISG